MNFKRKKINPYPPIHQKRSLDIGETNPLPIAFKRRRKGVDSYCGLCHYMFLIRDDKKAPDASGFCPEGNKEVKRETKNCEYYIPAKMFICWSWGYWITPQLCYRNNDDRRCSECPYKQIINKSLKNDLSS